MAGEREDFHRTYDGLQPELQARLDRMIEHHGGDLNAFLLKGMGAYETFAVGEAGRFARIAADAAEAGLHMDEVAAFWEQRERSWRRVEEARDVYDRDRPESDAAAWMLWAWWLGSMVDHGPREYDRQTELLGTKDKGHSGNTFGGACHLAVGLLDGQPV